jgi:5-methylcytosine-specific restriction endonuclease McrA
MMGDMPETSAEQMIAGLIARGISRERAEAEHQEIERELACLRRPEVKRKLRQFFDCFAPRVPADPARRPAMPRKLAQEVFEAANGLCVYCAAELNFEVNHPRQFTVDHIDPISKGGAHFVRSNLAACCRQCNSEKRALSADEFRRRLA